MKTNSQTSSRLSIQREAANCRQKPEPLLPSGWSASKRFFPARGEWSSLFVISPFRDENAFKLGKKLEALTGRVRSRMERQLLNPTIRLRC